VLPIANGAEVVHRRRMIHDASHHPYASVLRQRAGRLQELACTIEQALVMALDDEAALGAIPIDSRRARLCEAMLARNLHQLHEAADELRETAFRFLARADEFDRTVHVRTLSGNPLPPGEAA
jgi:hypothetical protein